MLTSRTVRRVALTAALAAVFAALPAASLAPAATSARFSATFTGTIDVFVRPTGPQVVVWATGTGTGIGRSVFLATGPALLGLTIPVGACPGYSGVASIATASGDKLFGTVQGGKGCRTSVNTFRSTGKVRILGGTGRFLRTSGNLSFTARSNTTGDFSLTLTGTL